MRQMIAMAGACAVMLAIPAIAAPAQTAAKPARCVITTSGGNYSGPCQFSADNTGSFVVDKADGTPLFGEVQNIGVYIQSPGVALAQVLTTGQLTQRWGAATRSKSDAACWTGEGFSVCVY